jgi:tetratricopeptide (TPR) repeat protein
MKYFLAAAIAILIFTVAPAQTASLPEVRSLARQSRYQEAYDRLEEYLAGRPADEQGRLLKGVLLARLDRIDEAIGTFRELAEDRPTLPEPYNNLAVLYAAEGRYDEARQALEEAVALQPGYATARENLGDIYARLAHLEYMRAYEIDGTNLRSLEKANAVANLFERIALGVAAEAPPDTGGMVASAAPEAPPDTGGMMASAGPEAAAPIPAPVPEPAAVLPADPRTGGAMECFGVSGLKHEGDAAEVATWFEQQGVSVLSGMREEKEYLNFQVYLPPLESRAAAKALFDEMRAAGINDIALIPRGGLANGISLGVYGSQANARRRMTILREMGYQVEIRHRSRTRQAPFVEATALQGLFDQQAFNQAFPSYPVERISCI